MTYKMDPILMIPVQTSPSIASMSPDLWLRADSGVGTTGARDFESGDTEYADLASALEPAASEWWIAFWIKPDDFVAAQAVFGDTSDTESNGIIVDITTGKISITVGGVNHTISTNGLTAGVWQHVCITKEATTDNLTVYIDGVSDGTADGLATNPASTAARASLIADDGWTITDGGQA